MLLCHGYLLPSVFTGSFSTVWLRRSSHTGTRCSRESISMPAGFGWEASESQLPCHMGVFASKSLSPFRHRVVFIVTHQTATVAHMSHATCHGGLGAIASAPIARLFAPWAGEARGSARMEIRSSPHEPAQAKSTMRALRLCAFRVSSTELARDGGALARSHPTADSFPGKRCFCTKPRRLGYFLAL